MKGRIRPALAGLLTIGLIATAAPDAINPQSARANTTTDSAQRPPTGPEVLVQELTTAGDGQTTIDTEPTTGRVSFVGFPAGTGWTAIGATTPAQAADAFLARYGSLFGVAPDELLAEEPRATPDGGTSLRYSQRHRGLEVFGAGLALVVDGSARVTSVAGKVVPDIDPDITPSVSRDKARATAENEAEETWQEDQPASAEDPEAVAARPDQVIYDPGLLGRATVTSPTLAWQVRVEDSANTGRERLVFVDADDGKALTSIDQAPEARDRRICDNADSTSQPGTCTDALAVRKETEGPVSSPAEVDEAHDLLGSVHEFYAANFGRDSLDGAGLALSAVVRHCDLSPCPTANAFWDGERTMLFGTGTVADDVVAHEAAHAVTQFGPNLIYVDQSGAINESMSDVFGELVDLGIPGDDDAANRWLIGEDVADSVFGGALRNMANPSAPPFFDPDRLLSPLYRRIPIANSCDALNDSCGVHLNSGVGNKAAALITDGTPAGQPFNGYSITGIGPAKAAQVYYRALNLLVATSRYRDLYHALIQGCVGAQSASVNPTTPADCTAVKAAVDATDMDRTTFDDDAGAIQGLPVCKQKVLPRTRDGDAGGEPPSSPALAVPLGFTANFFGERTGVYVNSNGNVTFGDRYVDWTPDDPLKDSPLPIIAPFFADVNTVDPRSDAITYGSAPGVFCVNWAGEGVGYDHFRTGRTDKLNRFQLLLLDRSAGNAPGDFDIVFNYDQIDWESGDGSSPTGNGLGGDSARAGFSAGTGPTGGWFELTGSGVPGGLLDSSSSGPRHSTRQSQQLGRHVLSLRGGVLGANKPPTAEPKSLTIAEDTAGTVDVLTGTSDPDGDPITLTGSTQGTLGATTCAAATGICTYTANPNAFGPDTFSYTVRDENGGSTTQTVAVTINPVNDAPTAAFARTPASGAAPLAVTFDASDSSDVEGPVSSYAWTFGDGGTATGVTASHTYAVAGTFTTTLTVTDNQGVPASTTRVATVSAAPAPPPAQAPPPAPPAPPPPVRDLVQLKRSGNISYQRGGALQSGDFVVTKKSGKITRISGRGRLSPTVTVQFDLKVSKGRANGVIVIRDSARGLVDRFAVKNTSVAKSNGKVAGTSVIKKNGKTTKKLRWTITNRRT